MFKIKTFLIVSNISSNLSFLVKCEYQIWSSGFCCIFICSSLNHCCHFDIFFIIFLLLTPSLCHCLSSSSCRTSSEMQFSDCVSSVHQKCSRSGPKGNQTAPQPKSAGRTILRHSHVLICSKNKPGPKDSQQQQQRYWAWSNHQRCAATSKGKMLIVALVLLVSLVKQHPVINSTVLVSLGFRWLSSHAPTELNVFNLSLKVHEMNYISCCVYSNCSVQCWIQSRMFVLHPQAIQDVDEFVSLSEQIWRNWALHHLFTNGSSAVNGCRQNESPNSW